MPRPAKITENKSDRKDQRERTALLKESNKKIDQIDLKRYK